ncbi:hypothetical protein Pfo_021630 [Paulownia fortunei]|nr:hypothetical protein Pfo_021630 [Paulownia fortunei]
MDLTTAVRLYRPTLSRDDLRFGYVFLAFGFPADFRPFSLPFRRFSVQSSAALRPWLRIDVVWVDLFQYSTDRFRCDLWVDSLSYVQLMVPITI